MMKLATAPGSVNLVPSNNPIAAATSGLTIPRIISAGIALILVAAALIFFVMLIAGGVQWMLAGKDKTGVENARHMITAALVGLVIIFSAYAISLLVSNIFGISTITSLTIPTI